MLESRLLSGQRILPQGIVRPEISDGVKFVEEDIVEEDIVDTLGRQLRLTCCLFNESKSENIS